LDNVVYRLGFAGSRAAARQLVMHGHILVNNRKVDIPSAQVKAGDTVTLREKSRNIPSVRENLEATASRGVPEWLELDAERFTGVVKALPTRDQIDINIREHLIVEHYSR